MRDRISNQLSSHLEHNIVVCASSVSINQEEEYHPGGSMLTLVGPQCGKMANTGINPGVVLPGQKYKVEEMKDCW